MPKLKNSNAKYWVIFKYCENDGICFKKLNSFDEFFVDFLSNNFVMKTREIKACLIILTNLLVLNFYPFLNAVGVNI